MIIVIVPKVTLHVAAPPISAGIGLRTLERDWMCQQDEHPILRLQAWGLTVTMRSPMMATDRAVEQYYKHCVINAVSEPWHV